MALIASQRLVIWLSQPEKGQPPEAPTAPGAVLILSEQLLAQPLSELTAPGAVVILSEQLLAQPLSELTAPGAVVILSQLLAQPLSSVLTAPGAVVEQQVPVSEQQLALSETAPGVVVLLLLHPANAERTATAANVVSVRIMLGLQVKVWCHRSQSPGVVWNIIIRLNHSSL